MSKTPTINELKKQIYDLKKRISLLEKEKGIKQERDETTLKELAALAKESKTYEEYAAKIEEKYPMLKEAQP